MAKYINKDALITELERLIKIQPTDEFQPKEQNKIDWLAGKSFTINSLEVFLDTIEVKEVDLEKEVELWYDEYAGNYRFDWNGFAKHFFELGMSVSNKQIEEIDMKTGIELIAEERQRQIEVEGWTKEHDAQHKNDELVKAAICYADPNVYYHQENRYLKFRMPNKFWPKQWDIHWFKPTDRIRDLVKAGALIAAEIDRLQAQKGEGV